MKHSSEITMKERHLAIVLLDIIGSTAFVQKHGAQVAAQWFQVHDRLTRSLVYKFDGREIDRSDGFLLSFNRAIDAVNFALHYQRTIPKKIKLNTRIGIHWGRIIEVQQSEIYVGAGAKRVELEGLAKNVAARTMSLCQAGQVLLTKEAVQVVRSRTNVHTPKSVRYACVGLYKFKGVKAPQEIYAVGETMQSLQPPPGSEKVTRIGGPKHIRKKMRDRKLLDWLQWLYHRLCTIAEIVFLYTLLKISMYPMMRPLIFLPYDMPMYDSAVEFIGDSWKMVVRDIKEIMYESDK